MLFLEASFEVTEQNRKLSKQIRLAPSEIMAARMTCVQKGPQSREHPDQGAESSLSYHYKEALIFVFPYTCIFSLCFDIGIKIYEKYIKYLIALLNMCSK